VDSGKEAIVWPDARLSGIVDAVACNIFDRRGR
jgi:hypothetical protein